MRSLCASAFPSWQLLAFSVASARARRRMVQDLQHQRQADLRVETSDANIRVTTWDQNTIEAKVETLPTTKSARAASASKSARREIRSRSTFTFLITTSTSSGDSTRSKSSSRCRVRASVNLRTGDGKIDLAGLKGDMDLRTGDGSENLEGVDGKLHATTGDGHIQANGRFDELGSRPAMDTSTCAPHKALRWLRAGALRPATAASRWNSWRPCRRCRPAHQRRPHRSRHAHDDGRQNSPERDSRQAQRRRQPADDPYRRRIDSFEEELSQRRLSV